ncbi:MAG: phage holin family protein [Thermodesulfobacteriota bacterium]
MLRPIVNFAVVIGGLYLTAHLFPGVRVDGVIPAALVALLLGVANTFVKPVLKVIAVPVNFLSLGLFTFVIDAAVLWYIGTLVVGFEVTELGAALGGAIIISILSATSNTLLE